MEWISVEDELPETDGVNESKKYIVTFQKENGHKFVDYDIYESASEEWIFTELIRNAGTVTHWMALPEPPKED